MKNAAYWFSAAIPVITEAMRQEGGRGQRMERERFERGGLNGYILA
jgi:hypothetical protein